MRGLKLREPKGVATLKKGLRSTSLGMRTEAEKRVIFKCYFQVFFLSLVHFRFLQVGQFLLWFYEVEILVFGSVALLRIVFLFF